MLNVWPTYPAHETRDGAHLVASLRRLTNIDEPLATAVGDGHDSVLVAVGEVDLREDVAVGETRVSGEETGGRVRAVVDATATSWGAWGASPTYRSLLACVGGDRDYSLHDSQASLLRNLAGFDRLELCLELDWLVGSRGWRGDGHGAKETSHDDGVEGNHFEGVVKIGSLVLK